MSYTFNDTFELSPLSRPQKQRKKPTSPIFGELTKEQFEQLLRSGSYQPTHKKSLREERKEQEKKEIQEKAKKRTPAIRHVIHKPTYCVVKWNNAYDEPIEQSRHQLSAFKSKTETFSGLAKSRMKNALNWLYLFADKKRVHSKTPWINKKGQIQHDFTFRLAFITLTLTGKQQHTDDEIKDKMLKPFLHWLQRSHNASYVWKAEAQLNGNIHFHITIDQFIHWKSIRAKWNSLLSSQGYVKMFQDGTNDKGDAATQIKAIKNEKGHAGIVGGYLTKGTIEEKEHYNLSKGKVTIDELLQHSEGTSCEWRRDENLEKENATNQTLLYCSLKPKKHYTRFIDGRLWSQSQSISNINVDISDRHHNFETAEKEFFHNNRVKNLGKVMLLEAKEKHRHLSEQERLTIGFDDLSLKKKYSKFFNVFIHDNLKSLRIPDEISKIIAREKANRNLNTKRSFTVETLL